MRLCSWWSAPGEPARLGLDCGDRILDVGACPAGKGEPAPPTTLAATLADWPANEARLRRLAADPPPAFLKDPATLRLAPCHPAPASFRDFYAFERHVKTARARRGLDMIPEWYEFPVFYFSNAAVMRGPGETVAAPADCAEFDFELEIGAVIGVGGRDIAADEGERHVAGYCVLNDWSARDLQREEMKVGLGPAKGKDFATGLGPWLVTPDELADVRAGKGYDLAMSARRDGREISRGNWRDIHFSFGELIARASRGVDLRPGELIGSGTVGSGCILELGPEKAGGWLVPGERLELDIERLGVLDNTIGG